MNKCLVHLPKFTEFPKQKGVEKLTLADRVSKDHLLHPPVPELGQGQGLQPILGVMAVSEPVWLLTLTPARGPSTLNLETCIGREDEEAIPSSTLCATKVQITVETVASAKRKINDRMGYRTNRRQGRGWQMPF
jgi:hypothetical protein